MKIECLDKKIILYLYKKQLDFDNVENLNNEVKKIFIKLIRKYHFNFFGYSIVHIYQNDAYGCIMEIDNIYSSDFPLNNIDLKIIIHRNIPFYLKISDSLFFSNKDNIIIKNNNFYINIETLDNLLKYLEYGKLIYKDI